MKFRDVIKGKRAIKRVALPLANTPSYLTLPAEGVEPAGEQVIVGVRVLDGEEQALVNELSAEWALNRGARELTDRDPQYNLGVSVFTCVIACVDPDSDPSNPEPFFGSRGDYKSAAAELLCSPDIGRDGIIYLAEAQATWQDLCSPQAKKISPSKLHEATGDLASNDPEVALRAFLALAPGTRFILSRSMAVQLLSSATPKYPSGATLPDTSLSSVASVEALQ